MSVGPNRDEVYYFIGHAYLIKAEFCVTLRKTVTLALVLILTDLSGPVFACVQVCLCLLISPLRARARFINHKHERMDPITLWRYVCLLNSVKSKETWGRDRQGQCAGLQLCMDTVDDNNFICI